MNIYRVQTIRNKNVIVNVVLLFMRIVLVSNYDNKCKNQKKHDI
jgi:hypothetical protein